MGYLKAGAGKRGGEEAGKPGGWEKVGNREAGRRWETGRLGRWEGEMVRRWEVGGWEGGKVRW